MNKDVLKLAFIYIGTIIGAGFASGMVFWELEPLLIKISIGAERLFTDHSL